MTCQIMVTTGIRCLSVPFQLASLMRGSYFQPAIPDIEAVPMTLDEAYLEKLGIHLNVCDAAIQRWLTQAELAAGETGSQLSQEIAALRRKQAKVEARLTQLRKASAGAWHQLKTRLESAWCDFSQALEQATLRIGV
jgi:hypothetical protein